MADYSEKIALTVAPTPSSEIIARVLWRTAVSFGLVPMLMPTVIPVRTTTSVASELPTTGSDAQAHWIGRPALARMDSHTAQ